MKRLLKILLYTILSIVAFIIFVFSAASILDIHYEREAHSHERLVKKAGLGGLDYALLEEAIRYNKLLPSGRLCSMSVCTIQKWGIFRNYPTFSS